MEILFDKNNKACTCYEAYVQAPDDRKALKQFTKIYGQEIARAATKLHDKLRSAPNASVYNQLHRGNNSIQLVEGCKDKNELCLKLRINDAYRKFFYYVTEQDPITFLQKCNWTGQYPQITYIYVYEINKHEYKKAR